MDQNLSWSYSEEAILEGDLSRQARQRARNGHTDALSSASCQFLTFIAATSHAKNAVEVGTGYGLSSLALLTASENLHLTSIDANPSAAHEARKLLEASGVKSGRYRLITGASVELLPRLAPASYDLVLLDGDPLETPGDVEEALRLIRPGGTVIVAHALCGGRVADPARREDEVVAMRDLVRDIFASEDLLASLLPLGDGFLMITHREG